MWYRDPTLEEELAAIALLRAQINLFTHPSRSFFEETAEEKKIHEEAFLTLLADAGEGVMRVLLLNLEREMRHRAALKRKGISVYVDPFEREFSSEATTQEMLKELDERTAGAIEDQLRQDERSG
jgi:hypothetical protein